MKTITLQEFYALGLLQEINRRFLHPMGIALSVQIDEDTGKVLWGQIFDERGDELGIRFSDELISSSATLLKAKVVEELFNSKKQKREEILGYHVQPIENTL